MPHDKNGVEVKAGDIVRVPANDYQHETIGEVFSIAKGSDKCNLTVKAVVKAKTTEYAESLPEVAQLTATASDCEKIA